MRHEMETLLFAHPESGFDLENDDIKQAVLDICAQFPNIEDINSTPQGAPSKRLEKVFEEFGKKYNKGADAVDIAELSGIEIILEKCPRFKNWVEQLIEKVLGTF